MRPTIRGFSAVLGFSLIAFSLCGSTWRSTNQTKSASATETALHSDGRRLYAAGEYTRASQAFRSAALESERNGSPDHAAMNWNNAGGAELARQDFRDALPDFLKSRQIAERFALYRPLNITLNNLAGLYLQMGDPEAAMRVAKEGLAGSGGQENPDTASRLRFQLATALARLHRFNEAEPIYRQAIDEIAEKNDFDATARVLGNFGSDCLEADRLDEADDALSEALLLVRLHHLNSSANILRALARLRKRQGDSRSAAVLFDAAIGSPQSITPQWVLYADRGEFRLGMNNLRGALEDFREARRIATQMRADIVPADQDRIALEGGLSRIAAGLVESGNRLVQQTSDSALLRETFDEAEQDRVWSLRALVPASNDWRSRLPKTYWDLLARYQNVERSLVASTAPGSAPASATAELAKQASTLQLGLQQIEAAAASGTDSNPLENQSALAHAGRVLDADSALFSFHITKASGWLWAVDRHGVNVYPIPRLDTLKAAVTDFSRAAQDGDAQAIVLGHDLYQTLFGSVAARYLSHKRWLLELDGPLFDLPLAALVVNQIGAKVIDNKSHRRKSGKTRSGRTNEPIYLFEHAVLQTIPAALMLEARKPFGNGQFLGIGDPIYNAADTRYRGPRTTQEVVLPRLPATSGELEACSRAWNPGQTQLLTGVNASLEPVRAALRSNPSIIHFATHVVTGPGEYGSGLIALSLDRSGAIGFMGPSEIVAHPLTASLVVLNGCHSGQGKALPGTGLTGLTRAWIGAGARSVLATRWDIPDQAGATIMVEFYRALRAYPERGPAFALQQAQLVYSKASKSQTPGNSVAVWGSYFVLGRE